MNFKSIDSKTEEIEANDHEPISLVRKNSVAKSRAVSSRHKDKIVIGADTIVAIGKTILHKPENLKIAMEYLKMLSGRKHVVYTGINIIDGKTGREIFDYEKTTVYFRELCDDEIKYYVEKYKPLDKAGAYGIQDDFGCLFIKKIIGDYYNIVGMPLVKLYEMLIWLSG